MISARDGYRRATNEFARHVARAHRKLPRGLRSVALTFDDGPDPATTPAVLDVLAAHDTKATFFLIGARAGRHPLLVHRILSAGHHIGSHGASHLDPWVDRRRVATDMARGQALVEQVAGCAVPLFRPPFGEVTMTVARAARSLQMTTWLWSRDPHDWEPDDDVGRVLDACHDLRSGDVVLLHDALSDRDISANGRKCTLEALPVIIGQVQRAGLSLVPIGAKPT